MNSEPDVVAILVVSVNSLPGRKYILFLLNLSLIRSIGESSIVGGSVKIIRLMNVKF